MTPADRARLMARVKRLARPFANAVAQRSEHHTALLTGGMTREELCALAVILAEAADPELLRTITEVPDDGLPVRAVQKEGRSDAA